MVRAGARYRPARIRRGRRGRPGKRHIEEERVMNDRLCRISRWLLALALVLNAAGAGAETKEVRMAKQYGIGYLALMIMSHDHLFEKQAKAAGLGDVKLTLATFTDGTVMNDALLSQSLDIAGGGIGSFVTLWDKTRDTLKVRSLGALCTMPLYLVTRQARIKTIADFTEQDRIGLPGIKVSPQAVTVQKAAAKAFGEANWNRLDRLTVNMSHPVAMQALLSDKSEVVAHFASQPFAYEELHKYPGFHTVLNSYDVWGPQTFLVLWTTSRFRDENPKTYAAFVAAVEQATDFINSHREEAARIYLEMTKDKTLAVSDLVALMADPQIKFTMTPEGMVAFADFKQGIGTIEHKPASWKEMFFPNVHDLPGS
jgi:NitT/TauT family transport system substrate-binding protein